MSFAMYDVEMGFSLVARQLTLRKILHATIVRVDALIFDRFREVVEIEERLPKVRRAFMRSPCWLMDNKAQVGSVRVINLLSRFLKP